MFNKKKKSDINLLPEGEVATPISKGPLVFSILLLLAALVVFGGLVVFENYQKRQIDSLNGQLNQLETEGKRDVLEVAKLLARTKKTIADYKSFSISYFDVGSKLALVESIIPTQVQLTNLTIQSNRKVSLSGVGTNPEAVNALVDELRKQTDKFDSLSVVSVAKNIQGYVFAVNFNFK